tara:strand:- start:343 stop:546 length:204 start_codon:yes stop_codon:yes gene_type:complete
MADVIGIKFDDDEEESMIEVVSGETPDGKTTVYGFEGSTDTFRKTIPTKKFKEKVKNAKINMAVELS